MPGQSPQYTPEAISCLAASSLCCATNTLKSHAKRLSGCSRCQSTQAMRMLQGRTGAVAPCAATQDAGVCCTPLRMMPKQQGPLQAVYAYLKCIAGEQQLTLSASWRAGWPVQKLAGLMSPCRTPLLCLQYQAWLLHMAGSALCVHTCW